MGQQERQPQRGGAERGSGSGEWGGDFVRQLEGKLGPFGEYFHFKLTEPIQHCARNFKKQSHLSVASGETTHETFPLMSPSRYGTSVAGSMDSSSIIPEEPEDFTPMIDPSISYQPHARSCHQGTKRIKRGITQGRELVATRRGARERGQRKRERGCVWGVNSAGPAIGVSENQEHNQGCSCDVHVQWRCRPRIENTSWCSGARILEGCVNRLREHAVAVQNVYENTERLGSVGSLHTRGFGSTHYLVYISNVFVSSPA